MANVKKTTKKPKNKTTVKAKAKTHHPAKQKKTAKARPEETMDRAALKGVAAQLKAAGVEIKVLKGDTDEVLQRKVNETLQRLPSAEIIKKLESVDPGKLVNVLKLDCLGIFIDLADVSCIRCPDAASCVSQFIKNINGSFTHLDRAVAEPGDVKPAAPPKTAELRAVTRYEANRLVFVCDVKNPNPKGDDYYSTIQRVLDDQPETLGELRKIVEQDFELEGDSDFMKFVTALRNPKERVIKLDVDLTDDDKTALREAGYEI